jgi:hypothetical protein
MRSMPRLFMAAVALISTTAFVHAQESAAPVPGHALDAFGTPGTAPSALPAIPFADGRTSGLEPALTIDPSAMIINPVAPRAPAKAETSAAEKPRLLEPGKPMTGKTALETPQKSSGEFSASFEAFAGAVSMAIVEPAANPAPSNEVAKTAQVKSLETEFPNKTGTGGWILVGLVVVGLFTSIARYRSRMPKRYPITRDANLPLDPVAVPARLT